MHPTRFRLQTFGRLALFDATGAEHALTKRRRQLAVLAYLSLSSRPVSRDTLATLFWGEEAEERARHSLSNSLSALRGALGRAAIDLGRFEVALSPDAPLDVDMREVARAVEAKDWRGVLSRVTGPFLDGVFVEGSNQFEDWLSAERRRVERWVVTACTHESARLLTEGQFVEAARVAEIWLSVAPLDTEAVLARLRAEGADGTPEAMRRATILHERLMQRLRQEFGARVDRRVSGFLATLGTRATPEPLADPVPAPVVVPTPAVVPTPSPVAVQGMPTVRRPMSRIAVMALVGVAAALAVAATAVVRNRPARAAWVLVADLERGGTDSTYDASVPLALGSTLGQSRTTQVVGRSRLAEVLRQMQVLDSSRTLSERVALDAAARIGADVVVVPTLARIGSRLVVGARLHRAESGEVLASERIDVSSDSTLLDAVDELARRVRRRLGESAGALKDAIPLPQATTASLPALRAYASGLRAQDQDRYAEAVTAYRAAIAFDSTFAQAHVALGAALSLALESEDAERSLMRGLALGERLPARERMLVRRTVALARRDWASAIEIGGQWLAVFPDDRDALDRQAYALFRARRTPEALAVFRRLLAVDSLDANAWLNFAATLPFTDSTVDEKLAAYGRAMRLNPENVTGITVNHEIGGALARAGRLDSAAVIFGRMLALDAAHRARGHRSLGYLAQWRGAYGEAVTAFGEAITWQRATGEAVGEVRARLARARTLRGLGRLADGRAELDSALRLTKQRRFDLLMVAWVGKELARAGQVDEVGQLQQLIRTRRTADRPGDGVAALLLDAEQATARGDARRGMALLDSLVRRDSSAIVQESRAHAAFVAGAYGRAAELYGRLAASPEFGWEGSEGTLLAPYWAARALEAAGDTAAARQGYANFVRQWAAPDSGLALVRDARARIGQQ